MTKDEKLTSSLASLLEGIPIYIATKRFQRRKHHKRRINKKWAKRYGFFEYNMMPIGYPAMIDGVLWMTQRDFDALKIGLEEVEE